MSAQKPSVPPRLHLHRLSTSLKGSGPWTGTHFLISGSCYAVVKVTTLLLSQGDHQQNAFETQYTARTSLCTQQLYLIINSASLFEQCCFCCLSVFEVKPWCEMNWIDIHTKVSSKAMWNQQIWGMYISSFFPSVHSFFFLCYTPCLLISRGQHFANKATASSFSALWRTYSKSVSCELYFITCIRVKQQPKKGTGCLIYYQHYFIRVCAY